MRAIGGGISWSVVLFLLLYLFTTCCLQLTHSMQGHGGLEADMVPVEEEAGKVEMMMEGGRRRKLMGGSFQICSVCTCCGGGGSVCLPSPCCYAINCNIPNRPFGFCSFTPKTCNCFGCHL